MKKQILTQTLICFFLCCFANTALSQVGINTTTPSNGSILDIESSEKGIFIPRVSITDLSTIAPVTGITGAAEEAAAEGLMVYNTSATTGEGFYYWNGTDWTAMAAVATTEPPIDAVSLTTDETINSATFGLITGMSLTFTARKTAVLVNLTASGYGDAADPLSWIELRVLNGVTSLGGTQSNIHTTYRPTNPASTVATATWSASFSKLLTGLTIGDSYTLTVEARVDGTDLTNEAFIEPTTGDPDASHLTLSVIQ